MSDNNGWRPMCIEQLMDNEMEAFSTAVNLLIRYADNILRNPDNVKFRQISLANSKVQQHLLPVSGAIECLFEMGFVEDGERFLLPQDASLDSLRRLHEELVKLQKKLLDSGDGASCTSSCGPSEACMSDGPSEMSSTQAGHQEAGIRQLSENAFYSKLLNGARQFANYVKPGVQEKARAFMPLEQLKRNAAQQFQQLGAKGGSVEDQLLVELLGWFKESFFSWMDAPKCSRCGGVTEFYGQVAPLPEERRYLAERIENYRCRDGTCDSYTRFPRFNDPGHLLETRVGRCGEWANCFTLCCLAAGLEARFVLDWGDHVWTEVYSAAHQRWLHADPCENVVDQPLLYEAGWGKNLSYVIAFSLDDVQDVTWRYTADSAKVLTRRTECREAWLVSAILGLRSTLQTGLSEERRYLLVARTAAELAEFLGEKTAQGKELKGRTTGSVEWRRARGELGNESLADVSYSFVPTPSELNSRVLDVKYSCVTDEYIRVADNCRVVAGWKSLTYEAKSLFRKKEHDWKMVYLAREEGAAVGSISWRFDLKSAGVCVDKLEIKIASTCYENGHVLWTLCGDSAVCVQLNPDESKTITDLSGCSELKLTAELSGGVGSVAWQHAQLFRQSLTETDEYPFHLRIHLKSLDS